MASCVFVCTPRTPAIGFVDLQVTEKAVALEAPGQYKLQTALPCAVDHTRSKAKFSRKRGKLTLTVPVAS